MDFELTDDQKLLSETAASFAARSSPVARFRKLRNQTWWDANVWRQMGELGWLAIPFPESAGGLGGTFVDASIILEKLGTTLVPEPYIASVALAGATLARAGSAAQHERWLAPMLEGRTSLALAYLETDNRHGKHAPRTKARREGGRFVLEGEKTFVLNGQRADHIVVAASIDASTGLFVLDRNTRGLAIEPVKTIDGQGAATLRLDRAGVETDRLLGDPTTGAAVLARALDYGAAAACAEGVGVAQTMLNMTVEYLRTREQFGVKIGVFQALQHRAVDMFIETELIRSTSLLAAVAADDDDASERCAAVSAAKVQLSWGGKIVSQQAIQLHGGIGITEEHDIGLYFKRMHALNTLFGDEEQHVKRFASQPSFAAS